MSIVEEYMFKHPHEIMTLEDEYIELILMALQEERKLWLMEYSREHNDYVVLQQENKKLKERINKAVEYIECNMRYDVDIKDCWITTNDLLEILKG